jgi:TetR/AcrR family tetracycline transcriptional repressor
MELLDRDGLDAFSMRGLAAELGIASPTLYWHVASRADLLNQVADRIVLQGAMGPPEAGERWGDWLVRRAAGYRDALLAHRDAARIVGGATQLSRSVPEFEHELAALVTVGFTPRQALQVITTASHFTLGHVLQIQGGATPDRPAHVPDLTDQPTLREALRGTGGPDAAFDAGLRIILAGAASLLDA